MKKTLIFFFHIISISVFGQNSNIIIPNGIKLPLDSTESKILIDSFNGFLSLKDQQNLENSYVLAEDLSETSVLIDELKGIEKGLSNKNINLYKGYLTNVLAIEPSIFLIQFSYISLDQTEPPLKACFEILSKKRDDKFYFYSPLKRNTAYWKTKQIGNVLFHYEKDLNMKNGNLFTKKLNDFDIKLNSKNKKVEWYGFRDIQHALNNFGVLYKLDYNGMVYNTFSSNENGTFLMISGTNNVNFDSFDVHDLWHERLNNVMQRSLTYKPVDEGIAYLYGGSWGISWDEIFKLFIGKYSDMTKSNWSNIYGKFISFGKSDEKPLLPEYVINALIVQKIEKEKGFSSVLDLLKIGKYDPNNKLYFKTIEKLSGINRENFNEEVWKLVNDEIKAMK